MSLKSCISKAGNLLSQENREQLYELADRLQAQGLARGSAEKLAVQQLRTQLLALKAQIEQGEGVDALLSTARRQDPAAGDRTDITRLPKGRDIPESVAVGSLEESLATARTKSYARGRDLKLDIQQRVLAAAKEARVDLEARTQAMHRFLAGMVVGDARYALKSNENAVGWYDEKVSRALGALATVHPEIESDPKARLAFLWALATTSNGLKVDKNFELAEAAYRGWKSSGRMPSDVGIGNAAENINKGLALHNDLADKIGAERLAKFMSTEFTAGEIERMLGYSVGGEWKPTPVRGAALLGPKIGNGFFSNLNGYFDALTMDRWLMRTWGRMTGTLVHIDKQKVDESRAKLSTAISALTESERKVLGKLIGTPVRKTMTRSELMEVAAAAEKASMKPDKREVMQSTGAMDAFRLKARAHHKALDGQKEAPSGPGERNWIRAVFATALEQLRADGKAMTMSDLQALLWYPERRLYDAAKSDEDISDGYEDDEAPDYANAAMNLALAKGVDRKQVETAMDKAEARGTVKGEPLTDAEKRAMMEEFRAPPEQAVQLAFEVAPDPNNEELVAQWGDLSLKERARVTKDVIDQVLQEIVETIGADVGKTVGAMGGYAGLVNPNLITEYKVTKLPLEQARALAAAIGSALDQDSVALVDPRAAETHGIIRVTLDAKAEKHAERLFKLINAAIPQVDGFTARGNNFDILNFRDSDGTPFSGMTDKEMAGKIHEVLDAVEDLNTIVSFGDTQSELVGKDNYAERLEGLRPGSGEEIRERIAGARDRARALVAQGIADARAGRTGTGDGAAAARRADAQADEGAGEEGLNLSTRRDENGTLRMSNKAVGDAFKRMVLEAEDDLHAVLFNWNGSELNEDKDKILGFAGRDGFYSRGKDGGSDRISKKEFFDWLASDEPFNPKNIEVDDEWREQIAKLRGILGVSGDDVTRSTRRDFLIATAAALAAPEARADVTLGRAKPLDQSIANSRVSPEVEKILTGNGRGTTNIEGYKALRQAIDKIASTGPAPLRALAGEISKLLPNDTLMLSVEGKDMNAHGVVEFSPVVRMRLFDGPQKISQGLRYSTLLHESLHTAVLARYRTLSMSVLRMNDAKLGVPEPKAAAALDQFRKVWSEFGAAAKPALRNMDTSQGLGLSIEEAAGDPDEFFVRALTQPELQEWMAKQEYEGKTLLQRFIDWVKSSLLGFKKEGTAPSWLDAALLASDDLLKAMGGDPADFKRLRSSQTLAQKSRGNREAINSEDELTEIDPREDGVTRSTTRFMRGGAANDAQETPDYDRLDQTAFEAANAQYEAEFGDKMPQELTPEFRRWFRSSKVVDDVGDPLVMYHGTQRARDGIDKFGADSGYAGQKSAGVSWFTSDSGAASNYANWIKSQEAGEVLGNPTVYPVYLALKNPARLDDLQRLGISEDPEIALYSKRAINKLKSHGFDGVMWTMAEYAGSGSSDDGDVTAVAFKPEQIKSAIGNDGSFDPGNADITLSSVRDMNAGFGYKVADWMDSSKAVSWWDKSVGTPYHLAQKHPMFKRVFDSLQRSISDVSKYATRAADMAPSILPKLENLRDVFKSPLSAEDVEKLSDPVFKGTLVYTRDVDGNVVEAETVGEAGIVWTDEELTNMWGLDERQRGLYREFRKATNKSIADLAITNMLRYAGADAEAVRGRVLEQTNVQAAASLLGDHLADLAIIDTTRADTLQNAARVIKEMANDARGLMAKGYAPLSRFGDYSVYAPGIGENGFFEMFENERDANRRKRQLEAQFPNEEIKVGTIAKEVHQLFKGITPETLALFGEALGLEESASDQQSQVFQEYLRLAKSTRSSMKHLIQRKGVEGYSNDVGRVLASFVLSNARSAAQNLNASETTKALFDLKESKEGDTFDHAMKLVQYSQDPREEAQSLRGLTFLSFIGWNVASAAVNLTQSATTTWPTLGMHFGIGKAGKAMTAALGIMKNGAGADQDLAHAIKRAELDGITDPQETHALQGQAQGSGTLRSGDGTRVGDTLAKMSNGMSKLLFVGGKAFALAEVMNRKIAFISAYSLARERGDADPYAFAEKIVDDTQFLQNKSNNSAWARGPVGAVAMQFKKFGIAYVENLVRMWGNGPDGKWAVAHSMLILFLLAGLGGFPGSDDLDDLVDGVMQRVFNKSFASKQAKREFFSSMLGDVGAEFVLSGFSALPGVPIDVSGRLGMGNLLPATGLAVVKQNYGRDVQELFGAAGAMTGRALEGANAATKGDVGGAIGGVLPTALANVVKAVDMVQRGAYTDMKGRKVIDTTVAEAVMKGIGFQPSSVKNVQDATRTQQELIALNKQRETEIADLWAKGRIERKPELVDRAKQQLKEWNSENPSSPIELGQAQINKRVVEANKTKAQRLAATAPKEIRASVKAALTREIGGE